MTANMSESDARSALASVNHSRAQVIAEIAVPYWYWLGLAAGWVGIGVLADYGPPWSTIILTVIFGAAHASVAPKVISGRRGSPSLRIGADVVGHAVQLAVIGFIAAMVLMTLLVALWFNADGARHPATLAGAVVAALVLAGGPGLVGDVRRRIGRRGRA